MPLKMTCPNCGTPTRVAEPYPMPGAEIQCVGCATAMSVTYPDGVIDILRGRGKRFADDPPSPIPVSAIPIPDGTPSTADGQRRSTPPTGTAPGTPPASGPPKSEPGSYTGTGRLSDAKTEIDEGPAPREVRRGRRGPPMPSVPAFSLAAPSESNEAEDEIPLPSRSPSGRPQVRVAGPSGPSRGPRAPSPAPVPAPPPAARPAAPAPAGPPPPVGRVATSSPRPAPSSPRPAASPPPAKKRRKKAKKKGSPIIRWGARLGCATLVAVLLAVVLGGAAVAGAYWYYGKDLPSVEALTEYEPYTVTEVYDRNGVLMAELYEQRRYVVPLEDIPVEVRQAFIAAEDASFEDHGGVDYVGLVRAVLNEATGGAKRQGASTITMQVTRNFLLTRDKTYERKIKEIILAQRIESVYDKDRILWLYLNELYLGSGAYGVEAASRVYFGKHVDELTLAEAALIAGLAPAPSAYSPHKNWDKAQTRQRYVLDQMRRNGFITDAQFEAAKSEHIAIVKEDNPFLLMAPHFTEHVRRHIVDTYGFDRVYKEGLKVTTTMDLQTQRVAQKAVGEQVNKVDQRMGFRRAGLETLGSDAAIAKRRDEHEQAMRELNGFEADPAGRKGLPDQSELVAGRIYDAVVLEAQPKWVRVGIGAHEAIIPIGWSKWVYEPNPRKSWRRRVASDLTASVNGWEEEVEPGGTLLRKGDVVLVKVEAPSSAAGDDDVKKAMRGTPAASKDMVAARLWQDPEVEAATMAFELKTGAVLAMVGGADFEKSEFNRVTQAKRQVGSTFKPIVYTAAVDTERLTAASIVPDIRGASYTTDAGFVWKPDNYGSDYMGDITLRQALALSKNTCTIKVLESMDPGMNRDSLYTFARKLGIGGPPLHTLPEDHVTTPENDHLCPWVREKPDSTICMDRTPPKDPDLSNTAHRRQLGPDDVYWCRACDMSMGLGSASLTMEELLRAYTVFGTGGRLVQPYYIKKVEDRNGETLEQHTPKEFPQVIRPEVATIGSWLLQNVVNSGTGAPARRELGMRFGGKTGTTQDYKDTWFVGYSNDVITAAWVGFDDPKSLGVSSTGGRTALPIWIDVMRDAAPKETDRAFPEYGDVVWVPIDENKGTRVTSGGRNYPFLRGTVPENSGVAAGTVTVEDFTEL